MSKALIRFVQNHKMKKVGTGLADTHTFAYEYQSRTWDTMLKTLFSNVADHQIQYKHPLMNFWFHDFVRFIDTWFRFWKFHIVVSIIFLLLLMVLRDLGNTNYYLNYYICTVWNFLFKKFYFYLFGHYRVYQIIYNEIDVKQNRIKIRFYL